VQRYLVLLAAGGSDFPITLLRRAGVDLTTPVPVQAALTEWERALAEFEDLIGTSHTV
jgi:oligoendopeptidase F